MDLGHRQIEVHREPDEDVYRTRRLAGVDATVTSGRPASIGDISVRALLGDLPEPETGTSAS